MHIGRRFRRNGLAAMIAVSTAFSAATLWENAAFALSDIKQLPAPHSEEQPEENQTSPEETPETEAPADEALPGIPSPDPLINKPQRDKAAEAEEPPPEVIYDISKAPEAVRHLREQLIEAAASGDIERLRPFLNPGPDQTEILMDAEEADPVTTLKGLSGDDDGIEILAILIDVLSTGFVHVDIGTPEEDYVWPYFAEKSLTSLTPPEKVELLRIVTAGDYADMQEQGNYNFFRVGISPDGKWKFFTAGD